MEDTVDHRAPHRLPPNIGRIRCVGSVPRAPRAVCHHAHQPLDEARNEDGAYGCACLPRLVCSSRLFVLGATLISLIPVCDTAGRATTR